MRVFADAGLSAAKDNVVRLGYDELRAAIAGGEIAHLWSVERYGTATGGKSGSNDRATRPRAVQLG